ncbi:MAG: hypothetical protein R2838_26630, partial [Caldilineaceae bacterium]
TLDDLPVVASVTSRWPLPQYMVDEDDLDAAEVDDDWLDEWAPNKGPADVEVDRDAHPVKFDEETDEMDALPGSPRDEE